MDAAIWRMVVPAARGLHHHKHFVGHHFKVVVRHYSIDWGGGDADRDMVGGHEFVVIVTLMGFPSAADSLDS
ncbi:hypothetical protein ACETU7_07960 [Rhodococcus sp. 3Y1]